MESSKFLCKIDSNVLESKNYSDGIYFTKPYLVGFYEVNYNTVEVAKKIYYFKKPQPENYPIDLNLGYHTYIEKQFPAVTGLKCCLKYAMSSEPKISVADVDKINVFTGFSTLVSLMECYYQNKNPQCKVSVTRYNGDLYLQRDYITNTYDPIKQNNGNILEPKDTYDSQLRKNLFTAPFLLIYVCILSFYCSDDMEALNSCSFVMTKQIWLRSRAYPQKYLNYWLQAYLLNITNIYFAYKDDDGFVRKPIVHKRASDLPKQFKSDWKPEICTKFLYKFLHDINTLMSNDNVNDLKTVYEFHIDLKNLTITYKIFKDNPEMILITPDDMENEYFSKKF
ncbi:hypothetical protein DOY81_002460 [Sarcophaga bullata]|nr:hypothetical protein DOY81_002460 [Sarcophaga bullata]